MPALQDMSCYLLGLSGPSAFLLFISWPVASAIRGRKVANVYAKTPMSYAGVAGRETTTERGSKNSKKTCQGLVHGAQM